MNSWVAQVRLALLFALVLVLAPVLQPQAVRGADPLAPPDVTAASVYMFDMQTGTPLYSHNAHERRSPASTTKVATAIAVMELASNLNEQIVIDASDVIPVERGESIMAVVEGDILTVEQLMYGLLIPSGNDAAHALARVFGQRLLDQEGGSGNPIERFVAEMNAITASMGLENTHFANVEGLYDPENYSSAYDMAMLSARALSYPLVADIVQTAREEIVSVAPSPISYGLQNTNQLLAEEGFSGVKTGTISQSGACLVASKTGPSGSPIIGVVFGSFIEFDQNGIQIPETDRRYADMRRLFSQADQDYRWVEVAEAEQMPGLTDELAVWDVQLNNTDPLILPADLATDLRYRLHLQPPGEPGAQVGLVQFYAGSTVVAERPVIQAA
jgi:serine-type D-Ala-D-Ala carboxypeptidase (penicillin-binding protein 5/6)